jgi:hypothetical protein
MSTTDASVDLGRLLTFALDITVSPVSGRDAADYARLVDRYLADAPFRGLFDGVIEGAGCEIATADRNVGLVLRTRPDGPWAWPAKSSDLPWNSKFEDAHLRAARALVVIALLAYLAPSAADLDDRLSDVGAGLIHVGVRDLEVFIRDFCEQRETATPDSAGDVEIRPLWWHWLQLPSEAPTAKRISRTTTTYVVHDVLSFLHTTGWLIDTVPGRGAVDKRYRPRRRLLYHFRDLMLDDVFNALRLHADTARARDKSADAGPSENLDQTVNRGDSHASQIDTTEADRQGEDR